MSTGFASSTDTTEKKISFDEIGRGLYAFTAEGDPNSGVIVGDDGVLVVDAQATPVMAGEVIERVRKVTDKPIKYVLLTHYHAVRVFGASAFVGAEILASDTTQAMIVERGQQDRDSEIGRFPRLFRAVESIPPGLTWPATAGAFIASRYRAAGAPKRRTKKITNQVTANAMDPEMRASSHALPVMEAPPPTETRRPRMATVVGTPNSQAQSFAKMTVPRAA